MREIALTDTARSDVPEPLYQAALDCYLQFGLRKITLEDIARKAGVSRSTIYRQLGGKPEIVQMIAVRELTQIVMVIFAKLKPEDGLTTWAHIAFTEGLAILRDSPVIQKALRDERETLAGLTIQPQQSPNVVELTAAVLTPLVASNKDAARLTVSAEIAALLIVRLLFSLVLINENSEAEAVGLATALTQGLLKS